MSTPQTALIRIAQIHRNLKSVGTVGTVGTASNYGACRRSHPIKEVGTGGNTHTFLNIRANRKPSFWLSLFPQKKAWEQKTHFHISWRPRHSWLFTPFPLFPHFLESVEHLSCGESIGVAL